MAITQLQVVKELPFLFSNTLALLTCFPMAIGILLFGKVFSGVFENKMFLAVGTISYEVYLTHAYTLSFIENRCISILGFFAGTLSVAWLLSKLLSLILKRNI